VRRFHGRPTANRLQDERDRRECAERDQRAPRAKTHAFVEPTGHEQTDADSECDASSDE